MTKKYNITPKQIQEIRELYDTGKYSQTELSRNFQVPRTYITAFVNEFNSSNEYQSQLAKDNGFDSLHEQRKLLSREKGFKSIYKYKNHLAKKNGFESQYEREKHRVKEKGFNSFTEYHNQLAKKNGFESIYEYETYLAEKKGFKSKYEQENHRAKNKGFNSCQEYIKHKVKEKGFKSIYEYKKHQAKENGNIENFILLKRLRNLLRKVLITYTKNGKVMSSSKYGLDYGSIINHLIPQLEEKGINHENLNEYHIDHIIPVSLYKLPEEIEKAFNPLNLRMFEGPENCSKSDRITRESLEFIVNIPKELHPNSSRFEREMDSALERSLN